jgi:hypothetical protein
MRRKFSPLESYLGGFLLWMIGAWAFMLGVGNVHAHLLPEVIPAGYWDCFGVMTCFGFACLLFHLGSEV